MAASSAGNGGVSCWIAAMRTHYMVILIFGLIVYFPRLYLSFVVFFVAQFMRLLARVFGGLKPGRPVKNRRILMITDYMPPQTHGIAVRCDAYVKQMRAEGHEVVVFATANEAFAETSFDHPNIPSVVNPFNLSNRIGYNPGVKLAWYLGAYTWDVVHMVYPSCIGMFVLPLCAWRQIPTYCSHHVEMELIARQHVHFPPVVSFSLFMYDLVGRWPALKWGTLNAAPTLVFAREHLGRQGVDSSNLRKTPSGTHSHFRADPVFHEERGEVRRTKFNVTDEGTKVILMVQRLSYEKGTERIFPALAKRSHGGQELSAVLVIAGDGPARKKLQAQADLLGIPAVFLGDVPHLDLPRLYRAADCFVTMSLSETFGLTPLEAMMCCCPAVMPYCPVFDETWGSKVPKEWRFKAESAEELAAAIRAAQEGGREYLRKSPLKMTWAAATKDLLGQYEECIALKQKKRETLRSFATRMDQCCRVLILGLFATWAIGKYLNVLLPLPRRLLSLLVGDLSAAKFSDVGA